MIGAPWRNQYAASLGTAAIVTVFASLSRASDFDQIQPPPPPLVTTQAWLDWYASLLEARLDAVTFSRDQTRYISSSDGKDSDPGVSPSQPWATVQAAAGWLNSPNPNNETREVLFKRGDSWRILTGITTVQPGVRIADYGDPLAVRPYFSGFTGLVHPNDLDWNDFGNEAFWRVITTPISWVREDGENDLDAPLSRRYSAASVAATPGSWWWSPLEGRLYIHPRAGGDPRTNGMLYECTFTTNRGFSIAGDRSIIENLRADGFGMSPSNSSPQQEAFQSRATGARQVVIRNCVSYYGSSHILAHNAGASPGAGGVATFVDCTAGFTKFNNSGETVFNSFAGEGGNQTIFHNCTVARGTLPFEGYTGKRSDPVFGHTGNVDFSIGLTIVYGLRILDHPFGSARTGRINNAPAADSLENVRVFFVGTVHEGGNGTGDQFASLFYPGCAYVNCWYTLAPDDLGAAARLQSVRADGWWINSTLDLDLSEQSSAVFGLYQSSSTDNLARLWNSAIIVRNVPVGTQMRIDGAGAASSPNATLFNSVLARIGDTGSFALTVPDTSANVQANAYWGVEPGSGDGSAILLKEAPEPGDSPPPGSQLLGAGVSLPSDTLLEFDGLNFPRVYQPLTIGPLEGVTGQADLDGNGVVNGTDLAMLLAAWGPNGSIADLNGDGVVNGADLSAMLLNWGGVAGR